MTGAQILVVEDETITARDLRSRLTTLGYRIGAVARSGEEAIDKAAAIRPDLVLMDISLSGDMDGVQAAAEIRARFGIPVTYLTAFADEETLARAQETAPYGYLVKPFDERELHATIQTALHRHRLDQEAEEAIRVKGDMVTAVTHELRASFATIVGFTELLLNGEFGPLAPEQASHLQSMEDSLQRMLELIRSTLDFSRLERQRTLIDLRPTAIGDLIAELTAELNEFPRKRGVSLGWEEVASDLPVVLTDPVKLKVVVRNLVVNALKYTDRGSVTVALSGHDGGVNIEVHDTGIGVALEARDAVFEPFYRIGGKGPDPGGVGLGLYITRRLVEMLGARISLESEVGKGSVFTVWIPPEPLRGAA
jgi:signal transduction histidine kinase